MRETSQLLGVSPTWRGQMVTQVLSLHPHFGLC